MIAIDDYWTTHTVRDAPFTSAQESLDHLAWRAAEYPLFHDLMGLWGDHSRDTVLDYGCGPANDMVGFLVHGQAKSVIGVDVSPTALELATQRLGLHDVDGRWTLLKVSNAQPRIALDDASVDHIYCQGVLHHTARPEAILGEFHRVLRPGGTASVMVYNRESLFFHLYVAYYRQVMLAIDADVSAERAFSRSTDGEDCPVSIAYRPEEFVGMCQRAGFGTSFMGGYYARLELDMWRSHGQQAITDERLAGEHRGFLRNLYQTDGYPLRLGLPAGVGGVYRLTR